VQLGYLPNVRSRVTITHRARTDKALDLLARSMQITNEPVGAHREASGALAFFDTDEPDHEALSAVIEGSSEPLIVSPYLVAVVDYLVASRLGVAAELAVLRELAGGAWELPSVDIADLRRIASVIERCGDQQIGVADASNVVLAERFQTTTIATLDHRHFSVLRPLTGGHYTLIP
jgi:uncharacterized protein